MNPFDLLKNPQVIKEQMEKVKEELKKITATGSSGGNMVIITLNGQMEMTDIKLDPICVDNRDIGMLQDLIMAAHHNATEKIQQQIKEKYGALLGDMNIPGLNI
ncbi:MAG: YbaB/EbfC family nucleoid-associated protein [Treponema sp.]|jgi:DNA-binding YbaB/EbfC family protein|nr:YbaB/EbfC family nucleoid-associated protein [Treponema sp.]